MLEAISHMPLQTERHHCVSITRTPLIANILKYLRGQMIWNERRLGQMYKNHS